ncbi:hypothetical protein M5K25_014586 [Dendrobium thyrsiflorum]|uniref:DUF4283 domain-containing protein n=1 Tax=Dendrobium thyrsiflorum TaxID=117978 RepID=A0ABD0UNX4_DENTH
MAYRPLKCFDPGFLESKNSFKSFRDVLATGSSSNNFSDLVHSTHHGLPSLWISEEEILALAAPFEFALLIGDFYVTLLDPRHVLIKLSNDMDYSRFFARRAYYVFNCYMKLIKWTPIFDILAKSPIVPVWIAFPDLRPHLFTHHILHGLGSIFVAWILVELDIIKHYPDSIWIGPKKYGYVQKVVFSDFPSFCDHCKVLGHSKNDCCYLHPNLRNSNLMKGANPLPPNQIAGQVPLK